MDFGGFSLSCSLRFRLNLVQDPIKAATSTLTVKDEDNMYEVDLLLNYIRLFVISQEGKWERQKFQFHETGVPRSGFAGRQKEKKMKRRSGIGHMTAEFET